MNEEEYDQIGNKVAEVRGKIEDISKVLTSIEDYICLNNDLQERLVSIWNEIEIAWQESDNKENKKRLARCIQLMDDLIDEDMLQDPRVVNPLARKHLTVIQKHIILPAVQQVIDDYEDFMENGCDSEKEKEAYNYVVNSWRVIQRTIKIIEDRNEEKLKEAKNEL